MRITNPVIDSMLKIEIATREGNGLLHKKFTMELSELVATGLFKSICYQYGEERGGRLELTPSGIKQLVKISAYRKIKRLLTFSLLDAISVPASGAMQLFEEYMLQLTKEELPEFLTSKNSYVRECAIGRMDHED